MDQETKVGSGGFVRYIDHLGSDEKLVKTARVSTGRGFVSWDPYIRCKVCDYIFIATDPYRQETECPSGDGHKIEKFPRGDNGILHHLIENRHTSPIEFAEIVYHLRIPMHIWRQVVRHRTANVSEYSTRYSEAIDEMETTEPNAWRLQATQNRQGSSGLLDIVTGEKLSYKEIEFQKMAREVYEERLRYGVAKEQARKDLPLSNYTEVFWKMDLHNLFHFLGLRLDKHAQLEARQFGQGIASIAQNLFPRTYTAFEEHKLYAVTLSREQAEEVRKILRTYSGPAWDFSQKLKQKFGL